MYTRDGHFQRATLGMDAAQAAEWWRTEGEKEHRTHSGRPADEQHYCAKASGTSMHSAAGPSKRTPFRADHWYRQAVFGGTLPA